jgi:hypothetical protein
MMSKNLKGVLIYTVVIVLVSVVYFIYAYTVYPPTPERETMLHEIGEVFGEAGLWLLGFIFARTLLKILFGKGAIARRLLPEYHPAAELPWLNQFLGFLNRTHVYVGVTAVVVILIHISLMGIPMHILFFPAVLILILWQALFGMFLKWRYTPEQLKKFAYLVHAQLFTGIMIAVFAFFGHMLIDS